MVRVRFLAALAAFLVLSTGSAFAQRESEERQLRDQLADRDEYRAKLLLEPTKRESLLNQQKETLAAQEKRLKEMYDKLSTPVTDEEEDASPTQASATAGPPATRNGKKIPPDTAAAKRAKDFEAQNYKTSLARYNVAHTQQDIADLRALLARRP